MLCWVQALRQALARGQGRSSNSQPHPNNVLIDTAQNLFSKGFKNLNSVKYALQGRVRLPDSSQAKSHIFRLEDPSLNLVINDAI